MVAACRVSVIWGRWRQPGMRGWRSCQPLGGGMLRGWVMARLGYPRTECCCLGQLPLQGQCLPHHRDMSLVS